MVREHDDVVMGHGATRGSRGMKGSSWGALVLAAGLVLGLGGCRDDEALAEGGSDGAGESDGAAEDTTGADDGEPIGDLDPGRVTLHRLNRVEYENTMRELLFGLDLDPAANFPDDEVALGYDNVADVLSVTPLMLDMYELAAHDVLEGALHDPVNAEVREQILWCDLEGSDPEGCGRDILRSFGDRAWRRPLTDEEVERLHGHVVPVMAAGGTREDGIIAGLTHVLMSVHFLFRVEIDPEPDSLTPHRLDDYELASRLSYFMWSTMPDPELFDLAAEGRLQDAEVLDAQVRRMLASPKALALLHNFAGQWLGLRALPNLEKNATAFPEFDDALRDAMVAEAQDMVIGLFTGERTVLDLLDSDQTVVNDRLAQHYGLPEPGSSAMVPVSLEGVPRRGLMTQAGMMALLSEHDRTSPTRRGAWILTHLLCTPPPPPPPDVDDALPPAAAGTTAKEMLEEHQQNPTCAACHTLMDPIGLAFENYDATGAFRTLDQGAPIDPSGTLLDGSGFDDAVDLMQHYADDPELYGRCVSRQLMTYALGREIGSNDDEAHVDALNEALMDSGYRLPDLLSAVVRSEAFRSRRGEPG